ncbi:hypothetical protein VPUCM_0788 [Vibrio parahaemolyticus UCM-V493]|nr:hypothetical protein VPUCM_0788 [Vibrio parahaemolyticus UCM-V493]
MMIDIARTLAWQDTKYNQLPICFALAVNDQQLILASTDH